MGLPRSGTTLVESLISSNKRKIDNYGETFIIPNVIKKINDKKENSNFIFDFISGLNYENKNKVSELLNPINFIIWLVVSFKDIF